jgi:hypothetical protein
MSWAGKRDRPHQAGAVMVTSFLSFPFLFSLFLSCPCPSSLLLYPFPHLGLLLLIPTRTCYISFFLLFQFIALTFDFINSHLLLCPVHFRLHTHKKSLLKQPCYQLDHKTCMPSCQHLN